MLDLHGLTGRERQITQLLLRGLPTAGIARELVISRHTVGDHVKAIFAKLGVSSRPELTALLLDGHLRAGAPARPGSAAGAGIRPSAADRLRAAYRYECPAVGKAPETTSSA